MNVLFISSGNSNNGIGILVKNQGESLKKAGINVKYFLIKGKGYSGYIKNIFILRRFLKSNKFDLIHAHYSFCGFVAALAGAKPLVVSLMGSDTYSTFPFNYLIKFFYWLSWRKTIVKTERMKTNLRLNKAIVIPNGVDLERFRLIDKEEARKLVGFTPDKRYIIFVSDPSRPEKNYSLSKQAVDILENIEVVLFPVYNVPNEKIPYFMNAADVLILTSLWEGGVNVIKEAAASNLPIVSVDVGDVKENFGDMEGCYVCSNDPVEIANNLRSAIAFSKRTTGRQRIIDKGLDTTHTAQKIFEVYKNVLKVE